MRGTARTLCSALALLALLTACSAGEARQEESGLVQAPQETGELLERPDAAADTELPEETEAA